MNHIALEKYLIDIAQESIFFDDKNPEVKFETDPSNIMDRMKYEKLDFEYPGPKFVERTLENFEYVTTGFIKTGEMHINAMLKDLKNMLKFIKRNNYIFQQATDDKNTKTQIRILDDLKEVTSEITATSSLVSSGISIFSGELVKTPPVLYNKLKEFFTEFAKIYKECIINKGNQYVKLYGSKSTMKKIFNRVELTKKYQNKSFLWNAGTEYCNLVLLILRTGTGN